MLALLVAIFGLLLAMLRSALQDSIEDALQPVGQLAKIVDLQSQSNLGVVEVLLQRYLAVTEAEFRPLKEQIVADAAEKLRRLAAEKRSTTLHTTDYYDWLRRQFAFVGRGDYVRAVSLSSDEEWNDSQVEKNFFAWNLDAVSRGAAVSRIFVVEDERLPRFLQLQPIQAHTVEAATGLTGYYVSRDFLERVDINALAEIGEGFIEFNGRVGMEDRLDPNGKIRGEVTMLRADLEKMGRVYQRLLPLARPLSNELAARQQD
jgi:hypothetical protein